MTAGIARASAGSGNTLRSDVDVSGPLNASGRDEPRGTDLLGKSGIAATALFPSGQVEIAGRRYEARLAIGYAEAGTPVRVTEVAEFGLTVEVVS